MIIARLIGGLGNQMFQYAMARNIALRNNAQLKFDISDFSNPEVGTQRDYSLSIFKIKEAFASQEEVNFYLKYKKNDPKTLSDRIHNLFVANQYKYVERQSFQYESWLEKVRDNTYITGFWPSFRYFENINKTILNDFSLKPKFACKVDHCCLDRINQTQSVSLHIRRGDYASDEKTNKHHGLVDMSFYTQAEEIIQKKVGKLHLFIFSDDIPWVKQHLHLQSPVSYVSGKYSKHDWEDLELMKHCKHNVIANSTFSWWGAWLNQNKNKIVISPKKWFNFDRNLEDLLPKTWIQL